MKRARISYPDFHCPHQHTTASSAVTASTELGSASKPSSSYNLYPLGSLYFCDGCDAIRCPTCVVEEVTTYFCPNCLFEVSSGSVRTEKTRCARNCFLCPVPACAAVLTVTAKETKKDGEDSAPSYILQCPSCRWTSSELGPKWIFPKSSGIGHQVLDREKHNPETAEFEALQNHFEKYLFTLRTALGTGSGDAPATDKQNAQAVLGKRQPSRNTAAAAIAAKLAARKVSESRFFTKTEDKIKPKKPKILPMPKSEDPPDYTTKRSCVVEADRRLAIATAEREEEAGPEDDVIARLRDFDGLGLGGSNDLPAPLTATWDMPFAPPTSINQLIPERIPLRAKMSKRCTACNRTLIRPESKAQSLRWKIKTLASTYIPAIELGNRRKLVDRSVGGGGAISVRRASGLGTSKGLAEERETLYSPLVKDTTYAYQLAFTNPLLEATAIKLAVRQVQPVSQLRISLQDTSFDLGAFSEPWELEAGGTDSRSSAVARPGRVGVERKGNITKIPFWAHVGDRAQTTLQFDLDVDFMYQAGEPQVEASSGTTASPSSEEKPSSIVWKTFTFRVRVNLGNIEKPVDLM